jgi:hypothetical protein
MAAINKSGVPSLATQTPQPANRLTGLVAGEALAAGDACYINADGRVYRSSGAATNAASRVRGFAAVPAVTGEAVTLVYGVNFRYGAGLTPGANVFLSATIVGGLDDAATTGGIRPIGFVFDATRIFLTQSDY